MRCYRCNSPLNNNDYCLKCGADVSVYKVVVRASNTYYNQGLLKARVRDLTGAAACLRTSLNINKKNIKARNLLGLVYFEMGEVMLALSEWVVSKNIKPERNVADIYINKVQNDPNRLDTMNQAIKKFNASLAYAKEGNFDIALIQIKKVAAMNPRFIKAGLLLGLLFWQDGQTERAKKSFQKVLKIDRNNILALKYLAEIDGDTAKEEPDTEEIFKKRRKVPETTSMSGHDVIIPPTSYKEPNNGVFTVLSILLGVVIGAALVWYLVLPAKLSNVNYDNNQIVLEYSEQLAANAVDMANLKTQLDNLKTERDNLALQLSGYTGETGESNMYSMLIAAADSYVSYDFAQALIQLQKIDAALLPTQTAKDVYNTMLVACNGGAGRFTEQGIMAYTDKDYISAENYLQAALIYDETNDEAAYYLGLCYQESEDVQAAAAFYAEFLTKYPESDHAEDVEARLAALAGRDTQEPETVR